MAKHAIGGTKTKGAKTHPEAEGKPYRAAAHNTACQLHNHNSLAINQEPFS
jgi:hypothetical protein